MNPLLTRTMPAARRPLPLLRPPLLPAFFLCVLLVTATAHAQTGNPVLNDFCKAEGSSDNTMPLRLNAMRPFNSTPLGGVLGTASLSTAIVCASTVGDGYDYSLQIRSGVGSAVRGPGIPDNVCLTATNGVGIRYFESNNGTPIPCEGTGEAFRIRSPVRINTRYPVNIPVMAELIKTRPTTALVPGLHDIQLDARNRVIALWPGRTGYTNWGTIRLVANSRMMVSTCNFTESSQTVHFGRRSTSQIEHGNAVQAFEIEIGHCGAAADANDFNDMVSFRFESRALIRSDGALDLQRCEDCAQGVAIDILTQAGETVDLTRRYRLKDGSYLATVAGEGPNQQAGYTHYFQARLRKVSADQPIVPGDIQSMLIVIIDTQ